MKATEHHHSHESCVFCHRNVVMFLSILYVLVGSAAVTKFFHPFLDTGYIAFNMTVVVFAGIIFGKRTGFLVGLISGLLAALVSYMLVDSDLPYNLASFIPHAIMGYSAGYLGDRFNIFIGSLAIMVGHALNMLVYVMMGLFDLSELNLLFWESIFYESLVGIIIVNVFCNLFLITFPFVKEKW